MNSGAVMEVESVRENENVFYVIIKRLFDIVCGLIGVILLIPLTIIIKIAYMVTGDFYSIFYTQERVGKNGKMIHIYKYRSMCYKADEKLKDLLKQKKYKDEWEKFQKLADDPRITKIGKIIRKCSIDEMPQFINVLKGDLSVVGPRPLVPGEIEKHGGNKELYESVKPGITGWWAVNGRSAKDYEERLELEYYYVNNRGLALDAKTFFKTFKVIKTHEGAK